MDPACPCSSSGGNALHVILLVCPVWIGFRWWSNRRHASKGTEAVKQEEHNSQNLLEGEDQSLPAPEAKSAAAGVGKAAKLAIVAALVLVVVGVIVLKWRWAGQKDPGTQPPSADTTSGQAGARAGAFAGETVLATVEGEEITLGGLEDALEALPTEHRSEWEHQKDALLEELITRKLVLHDARRKGIAETEAYREAMGEHEAHPGHEEHVLIDVLLRREVVQKVTVTEEDLHGLYEELKDELPAQRSFEEVRDSLRSYVRQEKQNKAVEAYIEQLREKATITRNTDWIAAQKAGAPDNPLDAALKKKVPVVADFGRGTCIPCKMMKPILDELKKEYEGKAEILIIDIDEYPALTGRCGIRAIPTQIFYDASGQEAYRHQGFMPREDIVAQLKKLGAK
jgi:thioredoxin 1